MTDHESAAPGRPPKIANNTQTTAASLEDAIPGVEELGEGVKLGSETADSVDGDATLDQETIMRSLDRTRVSARPSSTPRELSFARTTTISS